MRPDTNTSRTCVLRRQHAADTTPTRRVAVRGAPDAPWTRASDALSGAGNTSSRPKLKNNRAENITVAISALKMASATQALKARAAVGPATEEMNALKGAALR